MTYEEFMISGGARRRPDAKITIDIFDIASILTHYFQERGFLAPDEKLDPFGIVDLFDKTGYYLTVERRNNVLSVRRDAR